MFKRLLFTLAIFLFTLNLFAQGPVTVGARHYHPGDTIEFEWDGNRIGKPYPLATLHLWVDDIKENRRWKFRYPVVNGRAEGALVIPWNACPGDYAFNFMGSDAYLEMKGKVKKLKIKMAKNHKTGLMDTVFVSEAPGMLGQDVKYILMGKEGVLFDSVLQVAPDGAFKIPPVIFGDTATLSFKPEKSKDSYQVALETPLDSAFTPFQTNTVFIRVREKDSIATGAKQDSIRYSFELNDPFKNVVTMDEVVIVGRDLSQKFEQQYVSSSFRNNLDGKTFSGIENDNITKFNSILNFLQANIPGLLVRNNGLITEVIWRNDPVTFFIDEIRVDVTAVRGLPGSEIAMIKTYPPPATMTSFVFGGGIAIYTKRGDYSKKFGPRYSFPIIGYTQGLTYWSL